MNVIRRFLSRFSHPIVVYDLLRVIIPTARVLVAGQNLVLKVAVDIGVVWNIRSVYTIILYGIHREHRV